MPLVADRFSEIFPMLEKYCTADFWDLDQHDIVPGAIYLVCRTQFYEHRDLIRDLTEKSIVKFILANPHEGSDTMRRQLEASGLSDLVKSNRILLIGGGDMDPSWPCLRFDHFLPKIFDYQENRLAADRINENYQKSQKPYKFLSLNGRYRPHRAWMLQNWKRRGLLDHALWSNLDGNNGPIKLLPRQYEVERYREFMKSCKQSGYVKFDLFDNEWGEIYLNPQAYIDTYFSVISETVYDYPYSLRSEKTWKPIAMGHPFIVISNAGYLRDLRDLGFRTFGDVLDESYDDIDNDQERIEKITDIVDDLLQQDLVHFLESSAEICKYNQQHLIYMSDKVRRDFPDRFFQFLDRYQWKI